MNRARRLIDRAGVGQYVFSILVLGLRFGLHEPAARIHGEKNCQHLAGPAISASH